MTIYYWHCSPNTNQIKTNSINYHINETKTTANSKQPLCNYADNRSIIKLQCVQIDFDWQDSSLAKFPTEPTQVFNMTEINLTSKICTSTITVVHS